MPSASSFQLLDNLANAVESGKEYFLKLANPGLEQDVLSFGHRNLLLGTVDRKEPILTFEVIDGITYPKYNNEFLYFTDDREIGLTSDVPKKHKRLRLVMSDEDNTFQISMWDRDAFADLEWIKCAYGWVGVNERNGQAGGVKLILSPV